MVVASVACVLCVNECILSIHILNPYRCIFMYVCVYLMGRPPHGSRVRERFGPLGPRAGHGSVVLGRLPGRILNVLFRRRRTL